MTTLEAPKPVTALTVTPPTQTPKAPASSELRQRLVEWIDRERDAASTSGRTFTNRNVATRLGYSETMLSRYLSGGFAGDVKRFEGAIMELLLNDAASAGVVQEVEPFQTEATRQVARFLDIIRTKPQIGMVVGDAGYGKTSGVKLYREAHPRSTLLFTASPLFGGGASALVKALWKQLDTRGWSSAKGSRGEWLVDHLRGSKRLVIIDDAHELYEAGRRAVKSFFDLTGCPVALVGNPRIRQQWTHDDQNGSRVGFVGEVRLLPTKNGKPQLHEVKHLRPAVREFLQVVWPQAAADLDMLALEVAKHEGHLRALWLQCSLAQHLIDMDKKHGRELETMAKERGLSLPEQAFRTAHQQLVRSYSLPA